MIRAHRSELWSLFIQFYRSLIVYFHILTIDPWITVIDYSNFFSFLLLYIISLLLNNCHLSVYLCSKYSSAKWSFVRVNRLSVQMRRHTTCGHPVEVCLCRDRLNTVINWSTKDRFVANWRKCSL